MRLILLAISMHMFCLNNDIQIVTTWVTIVSCAYIFLEIRFRRNRR